MNTSDINYTPNKVKSVPLFPKGINRNINTDFNAIDDFDVTLDTVDSTQGDNINKDNPPATIDFSTNEYTYSEEGLLDKEGKVVKTNEQLSAEGLLDADGNVIDPTSKEVKFNKISTNDSNDNGNASNDNDSSNNNQELTLIEEIQQLEGYEILDETGSPKVYEDTSEGIQQYINDVAEVKSRKAQEEFFNTLPEVKAFAAHLLAGGTRESYFNYAPKDYKSLELGSLDAEQKANLVYEDYRAAGLSEARAKMLVEGHKKSEEIDALAEESLNNLKQSQVKREEETQKAIKERELEEAKATEQYWNTLKTTVTSGKIGNIVIPDAEKNVFLDYISKPVDDKGNTKYNLTLSQEDESVALQLAYWRFKGYDFNTMVKNLVAKEKTQSLKERINKNKGTINSTNTDVRGGNNVPVDSVSVNNITF
jgi:hypothetical protein